MTWTHRLQLRYSDLDYLGHVTAAAYLAFFEQARAVWLAEIWQDPLPVYVVARQELVYLREVRIDDGPLTIAIEAQPPGTSSVHLVETLTTVGGELKTRSEATIVTWDRDERKSRMMSERERAAIIAGQEDG